VKMTRQIITVVGGTGAQGGGVVDALLASGQYAVRVVTRDPSSKSAEALAKRGIGVVKGDLTEPSSLHAAFDGAYGAFIVTNFWDPGQMAKETEIGVAAVKEARDAGVQHLIWSTLPDAQHLTGGRLKVPHFTGKAKVDPAVAAAGFPRYTFVQAPFYFQNFLTALAPQPLPNGGRGWGIPIDPSARVIHGGDVKDVGRAVAAAFAAGDSLPNGSYLAVCGGLYSFNDFVATLNGQGHGVQVQQVPAEAYDTFFPGAPEVRETFQYFEQCFYFGPERESRIAAARAVYPAGFSTFSDWAKLNLTPAWARAA
jgi:uncharacterized protein YbjT (DUF2867 family)